MTNKEALFIIDAASSLHQLAKYCEETSRMFQDKDICKKILEIKKTACGSFTNIKNLISMGGDF